MKTLIVVTFVSIMGYLSSSAYSKAPVEKFLPVKVQKEWVLTQRTLHNTSEEVAVSYPPLSGPKMKR